MNPNEFIIDLYHFALSPLVNFLIVHESECEFIIDHFNNLKGLLKPVAAPSRRLAAPGRKFKQALANEHV